MRHWIASEELVSEDGGVIRGLRRLENLLRGVIILELCLALATIATTFEENQGPEAAFVFQFIDNFLSKPFIVFVYVRILSKLKSHLLERASLLEIQKFQFLYQQARIAFLLIIQFLAVAFTKYALQSVLRPDNFGGHARFHYLTFFLMYYPSFLLLIIGMTQSIAAYTSLEHAIA
jgi:hypothetical protein